MSRGFYSMLTPEQQSAFRRAVSETRDGRASPEVQEAWAELDVSAGMVDFRMTIVLYETVADQLALLEPAERRPIEAALFGGPIS